MTVKIIFKHEDGQEHEVEANIGDSLLEVARMHDISIEGSCGGVCACATCHVWIDDPWFASLPSASDAEENMLDNAQQPAPNSRLCCQVIVTEEMNGMILTVPKTSENTSGHHH